MPQLRQAVLSTSYRSLKLISFLALTVLPTVDAASRHAEVGDGGDTQSARPSTEERAASPSQGRDLADPAEISTFACADPDLIECDSVCVDPLFDPDNCGGCGQICGLQDACVSGACISSCPSTTGSGLQICDRQCVITDLDNEHCGNCSAACQNGEVCSQGNCITPVPLGPDPAKCQDGGPPILVDPGGGDVCAATLAADVFRKALCSCSNIETVALLLTDGYDSKVGPYVPGSDGGDVGASGLILTQSNIEIGGTCTAGNGMTLTGETSIARDLFSGGMLETALTVIGGDAHVDGDIVAGDSTSVAGTLRQPPGSNISGPVTYAALVNETVNVPDPCPCGPGQLVDVPGIVTQRSGANNDNALIGLDPNILVNVIAPTRLELPCGDYFLNAVTGSAPITIANTGHTALYIGGDIEASDLAVVSDPRGGFDIFVTGAVCASPTTFGSPTHARALRLYAGGSGACGDPASSVHISAGGTSGNIYGLQGRFVAANALTHYGSIVTGAYENLNQTFIHFDAGVSTPPPSCAPGAGAVPDSSVAGTPLVVTRLGNGDLQIDWGGSCSAGDTDYSVYEGELSVPGSHVERTCTTGGATTFALTPSNGSRYYLAVPHNGTNEGSYGLDSDGAERGQGSSTCRNQRVETCPVLR